LDTIIGTNGRTYQRMAMMTDISHLQWFDFSGAPALLIPISLAEHWRGFYIPLPPGDDDDPDVDLIIGEDHFLISDEFDLERPVSDYDRLCKMGQTAPEAFLLKLANATALVFNSMYENIAFWPQKMLFLCGADDYIDENFLVNLSWKKLFEWAPDSESLLLMNSCDHGAAPVEYKDRHTVIMIPKVTYTVSFAVYSDSEREIYLYRFQNVD
jgi:hypothetical protein